MGLVNDVYALRWQLAAATAAVYALTKFRAYWRLRAFKGPLGSGFTNFWHTRSLLRWNSHLWYDDVCSKYGSIARIGPNDLITSSPDLLVHMSAVRSLYTRGKWFYRATRWEPGKDHMFSELDETKHQRKRQQMSQGYSGKENLSLESSIDVHIAEFMHLIRTKYLSTDRLAQPFDFAHKVQYLTLDVISHVGFGEPFGDLQADADVDGYIEVGETGLAVITITAALGLTWLVQLPMVARLLGPSERDVSGFGRMMAKGRAAVEARLRRGDMDGRSDMLASFARHGLTPDELVTESALQIIAGADTTASSLRGIFLYLLTHPRVYAKLQAEVDRYISHSAPGSSIIIPDSDARKLPYLQAVIKEGMRVHPPVTDPLPKRVPDGGDTVVVDGGAVFLPGGTEVSAALWPLQRSRAVFGPDAHLFRPERWIVVDDDDEPDNLARLADMNRVHELHFGYGRFQCLGRPIALMEISKTVFELMRNFDWSLATPERPWKERNNMGIFTTSDMWVLATER